MKILLISHDDSITGAPKLLVHLADLFYEHKHDVTFVIKNVTGSNLLTIKKNNFKIFELKKKPKNKIEWIAKFFLRKIKIHLFINLLKKSEIVINNTLTNSDLLSYFDKYAKGKLISYIHELDSTIDTLLTTNELRERFKSVTFRFLVPSEFNKFRLSEKLNIMPGKISTLNYYIPNLQKLNKQLPLTKKDGEFWIGMCGNLGLRKGVDVFIRIAEILNVRYANYPIKLMWLGFEGSHEMLIREDIRKMRLQNIICTLPKTLYPEFFFQEIDVFALTSREDPYPLVVLEAANASKPTICFNHSGGIVDFVDDDCGYCVPYLNVELFCEKIIYLYNNQHVGKYLGQNAKKKLQKLHQDDNLILDQIGNVLAKSL